jgi:hypothetical protein
MSDDTKRIEHLKQVLRHIEQQQAAGVALDDNGRMDLSRQAVKAAQEISRLKGTR